MPAKVRDDDVCRALLNFVTDDTVPEAENVVSAEFPASAIPLQLREISKAKQDVENEISTLSRETASDLEGWVSQARQLHADIERSRSLAREIVKQHEQGRSLQEAATDASKKVEQLRKEIAFSGSVRETLEAARDVHRRITTAQTTLSQGQLDEAIALFEETDKLAENISLGWSSPAMGIISGRLSALRQDIIKALTDKWDFLVKVDVDEGKLITVSDDSSTSPNAAGVIESLRKLDMSSSVIDSFQNSLYRHILCPVLLPDGNKHRTLSVEGNSVCVQTIESQLAVDDLLNALLSTLRYLQSHLPDAVTQSIFQNLVPTVISTLIAQRLLPSIPVNVTEMDEFQGVIERIHQFAKDLNDIGCAGTGDLVSWTEQVPRLWLGQRRIRSLDEVRAALSDSRGQTERVERIEKGSVSQNDEILAENGVEDDWNAGWDSDKEEAADNAANPETSNEEEDMSGWGFDEEDAEDTAAQTSKEEHAGDEEDDAGEAWGWGDENEGETTSNAAEAVPERSMQAKTQENKSASRREITLKEYYSISDIPKSIIDIIQRQVSDAEALKQPEHSKLKIATSAPALLGLPTLVIAMFKATAPLFYPQKFDGGQMLLYNDSMYLAEQLRDIMESHNLPRLKADVETLEKFGRIAYSKEMQSQRTILADLLDVGQGFASCSEQPYQGECENAVRATVDRIRDVHKEWQSILSHSALLQSIGSLLASAISKMILDIEDLSDISDAESQHLAKFCNQISQLEDLFRPEAPSEEDGASQQVVAMTAMYVPNWLRFQYLINILESSLADIKYLWTEGELKLEFSPEEVVDLIKALFADSDHRRKAIAEIRNG